MWSQEHLDILAMSHVDRGAYRLNRKHMSRVSAAINSSADAGVGLGGVGWGGGEMGRGGRGRGRGGRGRGARA